MAGSPDKNKAWTRHGPATAEHSWNCPGARHAHHAGPERMVDHPHRADRRDDRAGPFPGRSADGTERHLHEGFQFLRDEVLLPLPSGNHLRQGHGRQWRSEEDRRRPAEADRKIQSTPRGDGHRRRLRSARLRRCQRLRRSLRHRADRPAAVQGNRPLVAPVPRNLFLRRRDLRDVDGARDTSDPEHHPDQVPRDDGHGGSRAWIDRRCIRHHGELLPAAVDDQALEARRRGLRGDGSGGGESRAELRSAPTRRFPTSGWHSCPPSCCSFC